MNEPIDEVEDEQAQHRRYLSRVVLGSEIAPRSIRRTVTGLIAGALAGFVEAGLLPKNSREWVVLSIYLSLRVATGAACAMIPVKMNALLKGATFGGFFTIPLLFFIPTTSYPRVILFGLLVGVMIGYWTERFGISQDAIREE